VPVAPAAETPPVAPATATGADRGGSNGVGSKRSSLEVWGALGPSVLFGQQALPEYAHDFRRVGGYFELGFAYRSSYFLDPFISLGYATLAAGNSNLPALAPGAYTGDTYYDAGTLDSHLGGWFISPGFTMDLWRFRVRAGLGLAILVQSHTFHGQDSSSTQLPLMNQLGVGFNALDLDRFRLDTELRVITAPGADLTFMTLDIIARGDLVVFGGGGQ